MILQILFFIHSDTLLYLFYSMESVLNAESLSSWDSMTDAELVTTTQLVVTAAGDQKKFTYTSEFKKDLSQVISRRWLNATSYVRCGLIQVVRIVSRDGNGVNSLLSTELLENILGSSGLPTVSQADVDGDEKKEALKCLVNALYYSMEGRNLFMVSGANAGLTSSLCKETNDEMRYFYMHLAFIITALNNNAQALMREDGELVHELCVEAMNWSNEKNANEALKVLFNLYCYAKDLSATAHSLIAQKVTETCVKNVYNVPRGSSILQNTINLLATLPILEDILFPAKKTEDADTLKSLIYEGRNVAVAKKVMEDLSDKLDTRSNDNDEEDIDLLGTYFTFLTRSCVANKQVRRYCRFEILPPLQADDVKRPPEEGETLRNKIIRVIQSTSRTHDLASDFLFVLCKRSVTRLIKYTGLGHSAGILANSGLLGSINEARRNSDSEDSETEDYKNVEDKVNPVTGYIREDRPDPMEGMSEEQKEYEALKLVQAMDSLMSAGIIKPGTIGPDGKPVGVSHVLELVKDVKTPDVSDDDSD